MDMKEVKQRLFGLASYSDKMARGEHWHRMATAEDHKKDEEALCIAFGLADGKTPAKPRVDCTEMRQYGMWEPYDPTDVNSLRTAVNSLSDALVKTISTQGQPHKLEWIVKDMLEDGFMAPANIDKNMLPPGYTCTVAWKAYFEA